MCHPHGLKIAQNRSKPLYGTIWHYMAHFGPFRRSNLAVYWVNEGQNTLNTHQTYPNMLHIQPITWYYMVLHGITWYGMVWYGMVWYGMVWHGMAWHGMVWYGMVWYGIV